ncbi:hypothetical protein B1B04_18720 [Lysinibacillus sp. KCTC 33748]|uniref:hypothetical protein n=1 Tax=unclassified Lysinibacillus TaxID=2636778 RepID=UPI0009A6AC41|nr:MULTISPECIES: hypothetical protein [unclassified Lysinibacillus]OXS70199.1 hypothetical protein B1B04_18720 [Lysinibacillus sp. KCTC 33748]SKC04546.1 hypothetical protein SAMN06295926_11932 [Lysinibacillus sp. AC-3]
MNKKLLFTAAAIPAALFVPTVAGAAGTDTVTVTGKNTVNETLKASIENLPASSIVKGYQWYYVGGSNDSTNKPISGATTASFTVPVEAAGKAVFVEATTTEGNKYKSEPRSINELKLSITKPRIESSSKYAVPGESVQVGGAIVTDDAGAKLQSNQITYSYQWFYKVGESFTIIDGATKDTYRIPNNALTDGITDIMVKVQAKVGTSLVESAESDVITISNEPSDSMIEEIKTLLVNDNTYNVTSLESFKAKVTELESKYEALSAAAKANVKNYDVLKRAAVDVDVISKLNEKVDKVKEINEKDLPKYLKEIDEAYDKLDLLQRSLDLNDALYNSIKNILKDPTDIEEFKEVRRLNQAIVALLDYKSSFVTYVPTSIESLKSAVETIEKDIAKLSQNYRATVQNQVILSDAKSDIKKVEQFIKLFDKLSPKESPSKQVTTAKSIRTAYEKLTYKQLQLVPTEYKHTLLQAENAENNQIDNLNREIDSYVGDVDDSYPIDPSKDSWQGHVNNVNRIINEYKGLTKNSAAKIVGYDSLITLQKDFKAAEKIIKDMDAYQKLSETPGVAESKLKTNYTNVLKAYNKLTSLQQSLVYNANDFLLNTPTITVNVNGKEPADKAAALALKAEVEKLANVTKYTFAQFESAVNAATTKYKNLSSGGRKYVTNYYLLTAASKDLSGVKSFHKKVQAARQETDAAKQAKKIQTVQTAYAKLPANQQHLAKQQYEDLLNNRLEDAPDVTTLNNEIAKIVSNDNETYTVSIEKINELSIEYKKLSSSDKKRITNASILTTAVSDVKKVESFMKTYEKSFTSNPTTVIKAFNKLTSKQMSLVSPEIRQSIIDKDKGQQQSNESALKLVESINSLLVNGEYIDDLETKVKEIRTAYDALSSSEKSVVKNYSKLTQAESDLKKVADVHALYVPSTDDNAAARKAWQTAYGKLSKKLEILYNKMYVNDL